VGTVTAGGSPSVSITGGPTNYALNFVLQAGPAGSGSGDVSTLSLYDNPAWITSLDASKITGLSASSVGLTNVTNESKATMFSSPTFTGTVSGVTATHVGLGNVTNESKATMFTSPAFTGTPTGVTAAHVGLGNVTNESKATMFASPAFSSPSITSGSLTFADSTTQSTANKWVFISSGSDNTVSGTRTISLTNNNITYGDYSMIQIIGSFTPNAAALQLIEPYLTISTAVENVLYGFDLSTITSPVNGMTNPATVTNQSTANNAQTNLPFAQAFNRVANVPTLRFTLTIHCPGTTGWLWFESTSSSLNASVPVASQTFLSGVHKGSLLTSSSLIQPRLSTFSTPLFNGYWEVHGMRK
jgi:hypothetical protein